MKPVYLVVYMHYGVESYFNTFDRHRATDYAAQHKGKIYLCDQWLALDDNNKTSQPLSMTSADACCQLAATAT